METHAEDYRSILKKSYAERCAKNARYSMRAFARDIGLSSPRLSEVLSFKDSLSRKSAERVALRLGFSRSEHERFCMLVESENGRSDRIRKLALKKLQTLDVKQDERLKLDVFETISDWQHFAILELSTLVNFKSDASWIAKKLGLVDVQVELAIERLVRLGLLRKKGQVLVASDSQTFAQAGIPSAAVRKFHKQVLEKAIAAIDSQTVDERELHAAFIAVSSKQIAAAKKKLAELQAEFFRAVECEPSKKDELYVVSMQFFRAGEKTHV